jgi:mannosyl-oligosaccharide alpha-1,2-mannosidase
VYFFRETGSLYHWSGGCVILSEVGTLHLEFAYLSEMTGNPVYLKKMKKIREIINQTQSASGLYPNQIDFYSDTGSRCRYGATVSVGALGDSFYEYLYKAWLLSAKTDLVAKNMFYKAVEALQNQLLQTSASGLRYFATMNVANRLSHEMEHLACFIGGLLAISARHSNDPAGFLKLSQDLTLTCRKSYSSTGKISQNLTYLSNNCYGQT